MITVCYVPAGEVQLISRFSELSGTPEICISAAVIFDDAGDHDAHTKHSTGVQYTNILMSSRDKPRVYAADQ
jgi:hypothetical protein